MFYLCPLCQRAADSGNFNAEHVQKKYADLSKMVKEREKQVRKMQLQMLAYSQEKIEMQQELINLQTRVKRKKEETDTEDFNMLMGKMDRFVDEIKTSFGDLKTVVQGIRKHANPTQNQVQTTSAQVTVIEQKRRSNSKSN